MASTPGIIAGAGLAAAPVVYGGVRTINPLLQSWLAAANAAAVPGATAIPAVDMGYGLAGRNIIAAGQSSLPYNTAASMFGNPQAAGVAGALPSPSQAMQGPLQSQAFQGPLQSGLIQGPLQSEAGAAVAPYAQGTLFNQSFPAASTAAGAATSALPGAAETAAAGGRWWLPNVFGGPGAATATKFGEGTLGRASLYAGAGLVGSALWNHLMSGIGQDQSNLAYGGSGALKGAGFGAALGTLIEPGLGTAIGAGVGGAGGALYNIFKPHDTPQSRASSIDKNFANSYSALSTALPGDMDYTARQSILTNLTDHALSLKALGMGAGGGTYKDASGNTQTIPGMKQVSDSLIAQLPKLAQAQRDKVFEQQQSLAKSIALQGFVMQTMKPYLDSFTESSNRTAAEYTRLGRADLAAQAQTSGARLAAAYATQASGLVGSLDQASTLQYAKDALSRLQQQSLTAAYPAAATAGTQSLTQLAAQ